MSKNDIYLKKYYMILIFCANMSNIKTIERIYMLNSLNIHSAKALLDANEREEQYIQQKEFIDYMKEQKQEKKDQENTLIAKETLKANKYSLYISLLSFFVSILAVIISIRGR